MTSALVAIDVAILVPENVAALARDLSRALAAGRPDALRLDRTHLPHVTLAQQLVERARLDEVGGKLDFVLCREPALLLRIPGTAMDHGTISLAVDCTPRLQRLHELVMDAIEPFEASGGTPDGSGADGETMRPQDLDWVRTYRKASSYARYRPHVTIGHGDATLSWRAIEFRANRIAVCKLGRFCTCCGVLRAWTLGRTGA